MKNDANPTLEMIAKILDSVYQRIIHGESDLRKDQLWLTTQMNLVEPLKDYNLLGRLWLALGMLHNYHGDLHLSEQDTLKALEIFETHHHVRGMVVSLNNLGFFCHLAGQYEKGSSYCQRGYQIGGLTARTETMFLPLAYILSNLAACYSGQEKWIQAKTAATLCIDHIGEQTQTGITPYTSARTILAEAMWWEGNLAQAWEQLKLLATYAPAIPDSLIAARVFFTHAHLAQADPTPPQSAEHFYTLGRNLLAKEKLLILQARQLWEEARYQKRRQQTQTAYTWAMEARQLFETLSAADEVNQLQNWIEDLQ